MDRKIEVLNEITEMNKKLAALNQEYQQLQTPKRISARDTKGISENLEGINRGTVIVVDEAHEKPGNLKADEIWYADQQQINQHLTEIASGKMHIVGPQ